MHSSMSAADFYRRQASQQPPSNDLYLIYVAIAYSVHHFANDDGKKCLHSIMRYLLSAELMLTLLCSDVPLLMLVVRIIVLICAFFNTDFIPTLTQTVWTMVRNNAPVVWQWLRDNAPVVWQWLREQWSDVRQHLAQQWVATERGRPEERGRGLRMFSPDGRPSSQHVEQENHDQLLLMNGENHSEERGQGVGLSLLDGSASSQDVEQENTRQLVPVNERSENDHIVQEKTGMTSTEILRAEWGRSDVERKRKIAEHLAKKKRLRDEGLPAKPESERAAKRPRT